MEKRKRLKTEIVLIHCDESIQQNVLSIFNYNYRNEKYFSRCS